MILTRLIKPALPVLAGCLAFTMTPLFAADEKKEDPKKEEKSADSAGTTLDQFKFGTSVANGEVTHESVKGKVVVLEIWGVH